MCNIGLNVFNARYKTLQKSKMLPCVLLSNNDDLNLLLFYALAQEARVHNKLLFK